MWTKNVKAKKSYLITLQFQIIQCGDSNKLLKLHNSRMVLNFLLLKPGQKHFLNKHIRLVVGEREYNGKKYPQVKGFKVSEVANPPADITISDDDVPF
jgi:hypothetical protein